MYNTIQVSVIALPFWFLLSHLLQTKTNLQLPHITRIYSTIHAIIAVLNSSAYLSNVTSLITFQAINGITISHAINDAVYLIKNRDYTLLIHHSLMIIGILQSYNTNYSKYNTIVALTLLSEISTIFLNNCWILLKNNNTNTIHFTFNTYMTLICFFIFRIINISILFIIIALDQQLWYCLMVGTLNYFNYTWFYKLLQKKKELTK